MPIIQITNSNAPEIEHYKKKSGTDHNIRIICEGLNILDRLLVSDFKIDSVLVCDNKLTQIPSSLPDDIPIYAISKQDLSTLLGKGYKTGIYACAIKKEYKFEQLDNSKNNKPMVLLALSNITTPRNVGAIIRTSAGLGANGVLLSEDCCKAFDRQVIRVSMGAIFHIPVIQSSQMVNDLIHLKEQHQFTIITTTLGHTAIPLSKFRMTSLPIKKIIIVMGNEAIGLNDDLLNLSDYQLTIPMTKHTDSLNVGMASAIFLYQLMADQF